MYYHMNFFLLFSNIDYILSIGTCSESLFSIELEYVSISRKTFRRRKHFPKKRFSMSLKRDFEKKVPIFFTLQFFSLNDIDSDLSSNTESGSVLISTKSQELKTKLKKKRFSLSLGRQCIEVLRIKILFSFLLNLFSWMTHILARLLMPNQILYRSQENVKIWEKSSRKKDFSIWLNWDLGKKISNFFKSQYFSITNINSYSFSHNEIEHVSISGKFSKITETFRKKTFSI